MVTGMGMSALRLLWRVPFPVPLSDMPSPPGSGCAHAHRQALASTPHPLLLPARFCQPLFSSVPDVFPCVVFRFTGIAIPQISSSCPSLPGPSTLSQSHPFLVLAAKTIHE